MTPARLRNESLAAIRQLKRDQWRFVGVLALVTILLIALYIPVFTDFVKAWLQYEEYNYALLVPFIALALLVRRWSKLRRQPLKPSPRGGLLLGAGLLMLIIGVWTGVHVAQGVSFIVVLLGLVWFLWGRGAARTVLFPVTYLICGLGLYRGLVSSLGFALQRETAHSATFVAGLLGAHAQRNGVTLTLGHMQFVVAQSCSGLSSLLALLALGWLIVGEGRGSLPYKLLLILSIIPLALVGNITRVALVLVIAQDISEAIAQGFIHGLFSATIFIVALALLMLVRQVLLWFDHSVSRSSPSPS